MNGKQSIIYFVLVLNAVLSAELSTTFSTYDDKLYETVNTENPKIPNRKEFNLTDTSVEVTNYTETETLPPNSEVRPGKFTETMQQLNALPDNETMEVNITTPKTTTENISSDALSSSFTENRTSTTSTKPTMDPSDPTEKLKPMNTTEEPNAVTLNNSTQTNENQRAQINEETTQKMNVTPTEETSKPTTTNSVIQKINQNLTHNPHPKLTTTQRPIYETASNNTHEKSGSQHLSTNFVFISLVILTSFLTQIVF